MENHQNQNQTWSKQTQEPAGSEVRGDPRDHSILLAQRHVANGRDHVNVLILFIGVVGAHDVCLFVVPTRFWKINKEEKGSIKIKSYIPAAGFKDEQDPDGSHFILLIVMMMMMIIVIMLLLFVVLLRKTYSSLSDVFLLNISNPNFSDHNFMTLNLWQISWLPWWPVSGRGLLEPMDPNIKLSKSVLNFLWFQIENTKICRFSTRNCFNLFIFNCLEAF